MRFKKIINMSLSLSMVFGTTIATTGCAKDDNTTKENSEQYKIYKLAVENGETELSYEEWLKSIKGPKGDKGDTGENGKDGSTWLTGITAPNNTLGKIGDFYFDTFNKKIYIKTENGWEHRTTINDGENSEISIGSNGNWIIDGEDSGNSSKGDNGENGTTWLTGEGAPTSIVGKIGDFYFDTINDDIYVYIENGWILEVDLETKKEYVLADGTYSGILLEKYFEVTFTNGQIDLFFVNGEDMLEKYAPTYEIEENIIKLTINNIPGDNYESFYYSDTFEYAVRDNKLVAYFNEETLGLLKGVYINDDDSALTLSDTTFALFYKNKMLKGEWDIYSYNEDKDLYSLRLDIGNAYLYVSISHYKRVFDVKFNMVDRTYITDDDKVLILSKDNYNTYMISVDDKEYNNVEKYSVEESNNLLYIENENCAYILDYLTGEATSISINPIPFVGNVIILKTGNDDVNVYKKKDGYLNLIPNDKMEFLCDDTKLIVNIYSGEIEIITLDGTSTIINSNLRYFSEVGTTESYIMKYDDTVGHVVELSFDADSLLDGVTIKYYDARCLSEEDLRVAISDRKENIFIADDIYVQDTIIISSGNFNIDLDGHVIRSSEEKYISNGVIKVDTLVVDENAEPVEINLTIKNGYLGNFDNNGKVIQTSTTNSGLSKAGLVVNGGPKVTVIVDNIQVAGYEYGFATNGTYKYSGSNIEINDSYFYSTMNDLADGAGAYLSSYATYTIKNSQFIGSSGIYAKSGEITLIDCIVNGNGDLVQPIYNGNGFWPTGAALVIDSAANYKQPLNVTINGGTYASVNNFAIQEIQTSPENQEKVDYAQIIIGEGVEQIDFSSAVAIFSAKNYTDNPANVDTWIDGKKYVYYGSSFEAAISYTKKIDLVFIDCTFNVSNIGNRGLYLTSLTNFAVIDSVFVGAVDTNPIAYGIDLNIYSTTVNNIIIYNNNFDIAGDNSIAISIKTRLGDTDTPSEDWASNATKGTIAGKVIIENNAFSQTSKTIYIGENSNNIEGTSNNSTGAFTVEVKNNTTDVDVYEKYLVEKDGSETEQTVTKYTSVSFGNK